MRKKNIKIKEVIPSAAIGDGEIEIRGEGFITGDYILSEVKIGEVSTRLKFISEERIIAKIPKDIKSGEIVIQGVDGEKAVANIILGEKIADNVHCVDNPVVDSQGNWYVTFSGRRDEIPPVSIFKVKPNGLIESYVSRIRNATSMIFDNEDNLFVTSRFEGIVYKVKSPDEIEVYAENLGVPTGIARDNNGFIYVGDRTGKIYKISPEKVATVFADLPESMIAYHLAFDPDGNLFVAIPDISSISSLYMINKDGKSVLFYSGFGRPQGLAFDKKGNLYVCEAKIGESSLWCIETNGNVNRIVASPPIVGVAFDKNGNVGLATPNSLYIVPLNIQGLKL